MSRWREGTSLSPPFNLKHNDMDNILTTQIQQFLQLEKPTEEQIREGATLLLRCNPQRERAIYNSAMTRPKSMLPWIKADLKKYLGIRQRGLTTPQVEKFNQETIAAVKQTLSQVPVTVEQDSGETPLIPQLDIRGLRPDHDQLPEDIQALFTKNTERWKSMRKLHAQLAQMIARPGYAACDGNELCYQLRQLDTALRNDYEAYDSFVIDSFQKNELAGVYNASGNFAHKNAKLPKSAQGLAHSVSQSTYKRTGKVVKFK